LRVKSGEAAAVVGARSVGATGIDAAKSGIQTAEVNAVASHTVPLESTGAVAIVGARGVRAGGILAALSASILTGTFVVIGAHTVAQIKARETAADIGPRGIGASGVGAAERRVGAKVDAGAAVSIASVAAEAGAGEAKSLVPAGCVLAAIVVARATEVVKRAARVSDTVETYATVAADGVLTN